MTFDNFYNELDDALAINKNKLDDDAIRHADLYNRVSQRYELELSRRDAAKQALEETMAQADAKIRFKAESRDEKVTEASVKSQVALDTQVRAARNDLHALNDIVGKLKALKGAYEERSNMIRVAAQLYCAGYFSVSSGAVSKVSRPNDADTDRIKRDMSRMRRERL